jgi:hypothetical protein
MNAEVITVCEYAEFNHSFLTAGAAALDVVLAPAISVPPAAFIGASVRVHARNISTTTPASYQVIVRPSNPSRRDAAEFQYSAGDASTPTITSTANPGTVPGLTQLTTPMTLLQHPYVKVLLRATPPATGVVSLWIIISVDLIWRSSP